MGLALAIGAGLAVSAGLPATAGFAEIAPPALDSTVLGTGVGFALSAATEVSTGGLATSRPGLFGASDDVDFVAFWVLVGCAGLAGRGAPGFGDVPLDVSGLAPEAIVEGLGGDAVLSPLISAETVPFFGTPLFDVDCSGMLRLPHMDSTMPDTRRADHLRFQSMTPATCDGRTTCRSKVFPVF